MYIFKIILSILFILFCAIPSFAFTENWNDGNFDGWSISGAWITTNYVAYSSNMAGQSLAEYYMNDSFDNWSIDIDIDTYSATWVSEFTFESNSTHSNILDVRKNDAVCRTYLFVQGVQTYSDNPCYSNTTRYQIVELSTTYNLKAMDLGNNSNILFQLNANKNPIYNPTKISILNIYGNMLFDNIRLTGSGHDQGIGSIWFDSPSYNISDYATITASLTGGDFQWYSYRMVYYAPGYISDDDIYSIWDVTTNGQSYHTTDVLSSSGMMKAVLQYKINPSGNWIIMDYEGAQTGGGGTPIYLGSDCSYVDFTGVEGFDILGYLSIIIDWLFTAPGCYINLVLNYFYSYLYLLFAIPIGIIDGIIYSFYTIFSALYNTITGIYGIFSSLTYFFENTIAILIDNSWMVLITTMITLVLGLRIWSFVKGISIFGWKLG